MAQVVPLFGDWKKKLFSQQQSSGNMKQKSVIQISRTITFANSQKIFFSTFTFTNAHLVLELTQILAAAENILIWRPHNEETIFFSKKKFCFVTVVSQYLERKEDLVSELLS